MNKPSIGRIVHFTALDGRCRAAIITQVWSDNCVDLHIFKQPYDAADFVADRSSVMLQAEGALLAGGQCHWPERV